jgi:hypothetical protein
MLGRPWYPKSTGPRDWLQWASSVQLQRSFGSADANRPAPIGGFTMPRIWLSLGLFIASTVSAFAQVAEVPEIDATSGLAAMGVVGAITALIWERRRRK